MRFVVFNSRKPRRVRPRDRWVRLTALIARRFAQAGDVLVAGLGPLHYDLATRCAADTGGRIELLPDAGPTTPRGALLRERYAELLNDARAGVRWPAAPRLDGEERDRALSAAADLAVVVEARADGIVERVGLDRLRDGRALLVCPPDGTAGTRGNARLLRAGAAELPSAVFGVAADEFRAALAAAPGGSPSGSRGAFAAWAARGAAAPWPYVVHFTRACPVEYPGETRWAFLHALAASRDPRFHDGGRVLERIVAERRIRAAGRLIRGGHAVVSFTAAAPPELAALARWARHLGRWTFEPFGVGLRRDAALARGLRPAIYGPASLYRALRPAERWLFQAATTAGIDWSAEREWRANGDVELDRWSPDDAVVLVPDERTAHALRRAARFPVLVLGARRAPAVLPDVAAG